MVKVEMHDDRSLRLTVLPGDDWTRLDYNIRRFPEKKWHADGYYTVPMTEPNVEWLLKAFQQTDLEIDAEAQLFLDVTQKTVELAKTREVRRWEYLFEDKAPDVDGLKWHTTPYKHQLVALDAMHKQEFFALFMEMGTGKTKVIIDEAYNCSLESPGYKTLIICPKTIFKAWEDDIKKHLPPTVSRFVCRLRLGRKGVEQLIDMVRSDAQVKFVLVNYERVHSQLDALKAIGFDLAACDESTRIKHHSSSRTKATLALAPFLERRVIMSGRPVTQSLIDLYSQFEFLSPGCLGYSSHFAFSNRYADVKKVKGWSEVKGYFKIDELKKRVARHAFLVKKSRCLDLPKKLYEVRSVSMGPVQRQMYEQMVDWFIATLAQESGPSGVVEARSFLAKLVRLSQITNGFYVDTSTDDRLEKPIPDGDVKLQELLEVLDELHDDQKALIWARFHYDHDMISAALTKAGIKHVLINGRVSDKDRDHAVDAFNNDDSVKVLIGEPGTGGLGLTLLGSATCPCDVAIYYSNDYSLDKREQSEDRCHRIGQTRNVTYIDIVCEDSIDQHIAERLQAKKELSDMAQDMSTIRDLLLSKPDDDAEGA